MIEKELDNHVIKKALNHFGKEKQLRKLQEECNELSLAISHYLDDDKKTPKVVKTNNLIDEVVDVMITIQYPVIFLPYDKLEERMKMKLAKLKKLIEV